MSVLNESLPFLFGRERKKKKREKEKRAPRDASLAFIFELLLYHYETN